MSFAAVMPGIVAPPQCKSKGELSSVKRKQGFRMIDPRRLRVLQAVAVHGSVAGAADALHLTPPAVSQQLLALERETGASLIDRAGRQVRLTAAGRLLAAHGERVAAQLRQAERDLAELTGQASGPVRIAAFQSVMAPLIGPALRDLAAASPAVQPVVAERYGPAAVAELRLGDLDIVLTEYDAASAPPAEPGLGLQHLAFDPYLLVIPPDWQVTPRSLGDLAGRPWVAGPPGTACDHALQRLATEAAIAIPAGDVCVEFPSVLALVAAGRGAAIIPQMALGQAPVIVCALPPLGGRHIAAWHQAGPARPAPATATVLDALARAAHARQQATG
jgi:DNA-binding transcriptional LysR family regulator